ncbi:hypothetical protein LPJ72_005413 [Coemansia sp. Benny D160-2]|nr:hypothetical protein LPJ72_005413 [Coemansia sp. Benny D160-2]
MSDDMDVSDRKLVMEELLDLLDEMGAGELGHLLRVEHAELEDLRDQVHGHRQALGEVSSHLHSVFAVAGGLATLPFSAETRAVLAQLANNGAQGGTKTDPAAARNDPAPPSRRKLMQTVDELRLTAAEHRADIADLEAALHESRATVGVLRSRLRDHELRQFAAVAAGCAGKPSSSSSGGRSGVWSAASASASHAADSAMATRGCHCVRDDDGSSATAADTESASASVSVVASTRSIRRPSSGVYLHSKRPVADTGGASASSASGFSSTARLRSIVSRAPRRLYSTLASKLRRSVRAGQSASASASSANL